MKRQIILFLGMGLSLACWVMGCAGGAHHSVVPDYQAKTPRSIAALPVLNETVSLKGADIFRPLLQKKISQKGYESPGISWIDERLKEKEIHEAGQVNSLTPQELGKVLGVDAVLYSAVTDFSTTYLLAYASMTVGGRFWLVDTRSGEKLWEADHQEKETKLGLDTKSIQDTLSFATLQSYQPFVEKVVEASLLTLPNGPQYKPSASGAGCLMP